MWIPEKTAQPLTNWAERPPARLVDDPPSPLVQRDLALFQQLREVVLPRVIERRESAICVWLVGCGTGEDAYAIAIELLRSLGDAPVSIRIFATDLEQDLIDVARAGRYDEAVFQHLDEATRATYLRSFDGVLRVSEPVRRCCVFARLDLLRDPPLGRMDVVVCRSALSALSPTARARALSSLHYALRLPGFLLVGPDEELSDEAFRALDDAPRVYLRSTPAVPLRLVAREPEAPPRFTASSRFDPTRRLERLLNDHFAPPCLLLDDTLSVLQVRGDVERVLGCPAPVHAKLNTIVGPELAGPLTTLARQVLRAYESELPGTISSVRRDGAVECFDVWAFPLSGAFEQRYVALAFVPQRGAVLVRPLASPSSREVEELREHVVQIAGAHARASQQLATLNDELAATNEELNASNEDLQSLNEELRTAQEQLLSSNNELNELNGKLAQQNRESLQLNSDLVNVFTSAEIPVVILDASARIRRFSSLSHKLIHVRESDIGRPFEDLRLQIDVPELGATVSQVIESGVAREWEVRDRDGRWHRLAIRPYCGPNDQLDGVVISMFDIDALKRNARRAEQASLEAERANRAKDEFLATLSHELRSPLHSVLVYAQLLKRDVLRGEKLQHAVDSIENGVSLLVQLLDELLDVSRIVSGKFRLRKQPIDLADVVARALEAVAEDFADKQLHVRASLPAVLRVSGDTLRLQQVVANLLSNAIKFTPRGGKIAVSLGELGEAARLCVRDDGIGIDPEFLPRVFDRFTQGDSSLAREYSGLGLGLHIVRQIVELHGGEVAAASDGPGQGAQFTVSLPVSYDVASEPAHAPLVASGLLAGVRILVVDDDRVARAAVSEVLSHAGAEVLTAPSAADGFEAVVECEPQLMLCDIAMPGEDGYSLIKRVRALEDPTLARIPALALTAFAGESDRERALAAGYQEHLAKPVDVDLLMQALSTLRADSSVQ